jgi:hypothetical protein
MAKTSFGAFLGRNRVSGAQLQETRDLNIIMHINQRSIAQKVNSRISGGISREIKGLNDKNRTSL